MICRDILAVVPAGNLLSCVVLHRIVSTEHKRIDGGYYRLAYGSNRIGALGW